jgi:hypothetical protein
METPAEFSVLGDRLHGALLRSKFVSTDDKIPHLYKISTTAFLAYLLHPPIELVPVLIRRDDHSAPRTDSPGALSAAPQRHFSLITGVAGEYGVGFGERC